MPPSHHPSAEIRSASVAGDIAPGAALAVAMHVEFCPVCAIGMEAMSGMPHKPPRGSAASGQAHLSFAATEVDERPARDPPVVQKLGDRPLGRWRWIWPGLRLAHVGEASGLGEAVYLLRASPGAALPFGAAAGLGPLVVLDGGFTAEGETFRRGDFLDLETRAPPRASADREAGCHCLIVTDGTWPLFGPRRLCKLLPGLRRH